MSNTIYTKINGPKLVFIKIHYIYKITNLLNNKFYIGKHTQKIGKIDNYYGSGNIIKSAVKKYGIKNFKKEIISFHDTWCLAYMAEKLVLPENVVNNKQCYNMKPGGLGGAGSIRSDETKYKISATVNENISNMTEEERRIKWGLYGTDNGMFGKTHSDDIKEQMSRNMVGNNRRTGKKLTDENTRSRLSEIASNRTGEANGMFGKSHSKESIEKIRAGNKGKVPKNILEYYIDGKIYKGLPEASKHTGIKESTIRHRCISKNIKYKDYYIIKKDDH